MPSMELGPVRPVGAVDARAARQSSGHSSHVAGADRSEPTIVRSDALDPGEPPVDTDRIAQIRKAVESGDYPLVPTKVADAMIAAGILLRSGK